LKQLLRYLLCLLLVPVLSAQAATPVDSAAIFKARLDSLKASFKFQTGKIQLSEGLGTLTVPPRMRFLDAAQSKQVLTTYWGNPESAAEGVQGMLFPEDKGPLDENHWAFVVSYEAMGYVKDDDAADIKYDELLTEMQEETSESNEARKEAGYPTVELLGWAIPPHYDKEAHALHWAKKLQFEDSEGPTLNYDVRMLGRKGVLSLNAVGDPMQIAMIQAAIPAVVKGTDFTTGLRYADFDPKIDEVAAYSLGGLVAGKVLAKLGFFAIIAKFGKVILLALLKFWKVLIMLAAGGISALRRFFTGRSKEEEEPQLALESAVEEPSPSDEV
jgi:uncharacterized membrane-anchored protein